MKTILCGFALVWLVGCTGTVAPKTVAPQSISFDGNERNGGLIGFAPNGNCIITPRAHLRYNVLIACQQEFGNTGRVLPVPLVADEGIVARPDGNFELDAQHFRSFATLNRWFKETRGTR